MRLRLGELGEMPCLADGQVVSGGTREVVIAVARDDPRVRPAAQQWIGKRVLRAAEWGENARNNSPGQPAKFRHDVPHATYMPLGGCAANVNRVNVEAGECKGGLTDEARRGWIPVSVHGTGVGKPIYARVLSDWRSSGCTLQPGGTLKGPVVAVQTLSDVPADRFMTIDEAAGSK